MRKVPKAGNSALLQKATSQPSNILMTDERCENDRMEEAKNDKFYGRCDACLFSLLFNLKQNAEDERKNGKE